MRECGYVVECACYCDCGVLMCAYFDCVWCGAWFVVPLADIGLLIDVLVCW